jgi:F420H(2)-dependent quinone reductase
MIEHLTEIFYRLHITITRSSSTAEPKRSQLYAKMVEMMPGFAEYERKTSRKIPVLTLERIASAR